MASLLFKDFIYLFLNILFIFKEKGREGEREGKKHQCVVAAHVAPTGDLACNPGMCPDWELSPEPFGLQAGTQCTEPTQPGPASLFYYGTRTHKMYYPNHFVSLEWLTVTICPLLYNRSLEIFHLAKLKVYTH